ncbi:hypothetical protein Tco_1016445 [Tanacetum coccineum]|uniref:Retrovirus-related Pol polyprotein from transposon TNT 1-94-like beta-barrel domain-containing protein n=1 Tax=Tanacetum coccineum TaxID=301880 RepID=A0ABQ5FPW4_9ASTR
MDKRMTGAKFDIEKFNGTGDFGLWRVKMRALLIQHGCEATLEVLPEDMESSQCRDFVFRGSYILFTCIRKMTEAKDDGGEGLYVRGRSGQRDMEQGTDSSWNEDQVSSSRADGRDYLVDFEEYNGGNILLSDGRECRVRGTGKVQVQMRDGSSFVLDNVRYVPQLRRNLISLVTLEKGGFTVKMQSGKIKVIKGSLVVLSETKKANCIYTLDGQAVTKNTLKGRKQFGE